MTYPRISVIVPHFEDLDGLDKCLTALAQQTVEAATIEIIVADNMSPVGLGAVERTIAGRARLVAVAEKGAGPTRNGGAAAARGDYLAFTDSDCVPSPAWLGAGTSALDVYDIVGGAMRVSVADPRHMTAAEAFEAEFAFANDHYVRKLGFSVTANLFVRRADFERVGGFRAGIPEDFEWCQRATRAGLSIGYAEAALVTHPARRTWPELERKWRRLTQEDYRFARERGEDRARWLLKSCAMPISIIPHAIRAAVSPRLPDARTKLLAISILTRLRLWRMAERVRLMRAET